MGVKHFKLKLNFIHSIRAYPNKKILIFFFFLLQPLERLKSAFDDDMHHLKNHIENHSVRLPDLSNDFEVFSDDRKYIIT